MGLHPNPNRTRSASVTSEVIRIRQTPSLTTPFMNRSQTDDEGGSVEEKTPLLKRTVMETDTPTVSLSTSSTEGLGSSLSGSLEKVRKKGLWFWLQWLKIIILFAITLLCCVVLVQHEELGTDLHEIVATPALQTMHSAGYDTSYPIMEVMLRGPFYEDTNHTDKGEQLHVYAEPHPTNNTGWKLRINKTALSYGDITESHHQFRCSRVGTSSGTERCNLSLSINNAEGWGDMAVPLVYSVHRLSTQVDHKTLYAALILVFVYVLIIFELIHRTLAAMLGALAALAVLSALNQRPATETIIGWMEMETLMLLFGMMIIVAVLSDTGVFDYFAFKAYKLAKGQVWPLITLLCVFSAVVSAFLDNVTTIMLMTPVTIRLCEVLNLEPRVVLIAEVLFSNIGGTATAIGDPPNVIIVSALQHERVTFGVFTAHMILGIMFVILAAYGFLRLYYRNIRQLSNPDPPDIADLKHEIDMWRRAASRLVVVTREETLMRALFLKKAVELENVLNRTLHRRRRVERRDLNEKFRQLERDYQIRDKGLLLKCGFVLAIVLIFFFVYSFVTSIHISLGWIAVLGAMWLLVIADKSDLENILHKVEWSTLLFFAALFILMEALAELGLMEWIGEQMKAMIVTVDSDFRLTAAVVIIVWISALASSFIDNIPFTTAMIPVLKQLCADTEMGLDLLPMVIALAFGACLGGNGTLIGASANVVCAGIAEQHGYAISFKQFFKVGFPMMLVTTVVATAYLMVCHSLIKWNTI
ncbi:hypothetical protein ACOMHN_055635 [Nucella lapillus]